MTEEDIRDHCLSMPGATEGFPFGNETLVFKVNNKVFCIMPLDKHPITFNVKCDPAEAIELREKYDAVQPGYHMNKKHWNTVTIDGTIAPAMLKAFIAGSHKLVSK